VFAQLDNKSFEIGRWQFLVARSPKVLEQDLEDYFQLIAAGELADDFKLLENGPGRASRGSVCRTLLNGSPLVIRKYFRGGLVRHFNKDLHFGIGEEPRPFRELKLLDTLCSKGFLTTEPVFAAVQKTMAGAFYRGFLATKELVGYQNLLSMILEKKERVQEYSNITGITAAKLLRDGVLHRDLHPGNVLVDGENGKVAIIDFDQFASDQPIERGQEFLLERWSRSILKHSLDHSIAEEFEQGLRNSGSEDDERAR